MESNPQQSLDYVSWCIDCSISTKGRLRGNVALEHMKNREMETIWKEQGKETILRVFINRFTYRDNAPCVTHQT
jgi:hypothetical protein